MATQETSDQAVRDWLERQVRTGRLLELPSYAPEIGGPSHRPERFARQLLDDLDGRGAGARSALQAAIDAELFRDWFREQAPPRSWLANPRIIGPMADEPAPESKSGRTPPDVEADTIGRALRTIAHPTGEAPDWPIVPPPRPRVRPWRPVLPRILPVLPMLLVPFSLILIGRLIGSRPLEEKVWGAFVAGYLWILMVVLMVGLGRAAAERRWRQAATSARGKRAYTIMPWLLLTCLTLGAGLAIAAARAGREVRISGEQARTWGWASAFLIVISGGLLLGEWLARRSRKPAGSGPSGATRHPLD